MTSAPAALPVEGLPVTVNGRARRLVALGLSQGPDSLPIWRVNLDGGEGCASTLEGALLFAARAAEAGEQAGEDRRLL